jgi:hypothetical protein
MAKSFNLTLELNLRGPSNLKTVTSRLKKELSAASSTLNINVDKRSLGSIDAATDKLKVMASALERAQSAAAGLNRSLKTIDASFGKLQRTTNAANKNLQKINAQTAKATKNFNKIDRAVKKGTKSISNQIRSIAGYSVVNRAIGGITTAFDSATRAFIQYERNLNRVQQLTNASGGSINNLSKVIRSLSTSLGVASSELAQVAVTFTQTGLSASEVEVALKAVAQASLSPTFSSMGDAAEGAIAVFRQFDIATGQLEATFDSINAVAGKFAVEFDDIVSAIQRGGGAFAVAAKGIDTGAESLNKFIALFTAARATTRESAETIATGIRTITARLQRLGTQVAIEDLIGVQLSDDGQFVGVYKAIEIISQRIKELGLSTQDVRFAQLVEELGGIRQISRVIPLITEFETAQEALNVAQNASGSTSKAASQAQQTLQVQLQKTLEAWNDLVGSFANNGPLRAVAGFVLQLTRGFLNFAKAFEPFAPIIATLAGIKIAKGLSNLLGGGMGGLLGGGDNSAQVANTAATQEQTSASQTTAQAINTNTNSLVILNGSINSLIQSINNFSVNPIVGDSGDFASSAEGFARGGVVPGTGNRDTVPAMLTPGEFVIRKNAVKALGTEKLHAMNKYAQGGAILKEDTVGVATLDPAKASQLVDPNTIVSNVAKDRQSKVSSVLGPKNYKVSIEGLQPKISDAVNKSIQGRTKGLVDGVSQDFNKFVGKNFSPLGVSAPGKIVASELDNFIGTINDGLRGSAFEALLNNIEKQGNYANSNDPNAPFDFEQGLGAAKNLYSSLDMDFVDAKAKQGDKTTTAAIGRKIGNEIYESTQGLSEQEVSSLKSQNPNYNPVLAAFRSALTSIIPPVRQGKNIPYFTSADVKPGSIEEQLIQAANQAGVPLNKINQFIQDGINQGILFPRKNNQFGLRDISAKKPQGAQNGGFIQKFSEGGQAEAIVNQIKEMSDIDAINFYTNKSRRLNTYYDQGKESELNDTYKSAAKTLDQLFNDDLPDTVYAGFGQSRTKRLLGDRKNQYNLDNIIGDTVTFPAYFSTSEYRDVASDFSQRGGGLNSVSDIKTKGKGIDVEAAFERAGTEGRSIQRVNIDEYEYILPRGSSFRIDNAEATDSSNSLEFDLTQLAKGGMIQKFAEGGGAEKQYGKISLRTGDRISAGYIPEEGQTPTYGYSPSVNEFLEKNNQRQGYVIADKIGDNLYSVQSSSATKGYGPRLYDAVMEAATEAGGMLTSDRRSVSESAKKVWDFYFNRRSDVNKTPLDPINWTSNARLIDEKLYGKPDTWPPKTDPAWVLQTGYSKNPSLINNPDFVEKLKMGGAIQEFATGGGVGEDTVPALLTPGEFVINKKAAARIGSANLNKMNRADKISGFNKGGPVGMVQRFADGGDVFDILQQDSGQSVKAFTKTLKQELLALSKNLVDGLKDAKKGFSTEIGKARAELAAGGDETEIRESLSSSLGTIGASVGITDPAQINKAIDDVVNGLKNNLSIEEIKTSSNELNSILQAQISNQDALDQSIQSLALSTGIATDKLKEIATIKDLEQKQFAESSTGKQFGALAEFGGVEKFAQSKFGSKLVGASKFVSGEGDSRASKLLGQAGGVAGVGAALSVGTGLIADQLKGISDKFGLGLSQSTTFAGVTGGLQQAGASGASAAVLGAQIAGPVGGLIAGVGGAIIGGIEGYFAGVNKQFITNTLNDIGKSAEKLDYAFQQLDKELNQANITSALQQFGNVLTDTSKLDTLAFAAEGPTAGDIGAGAGITATAAATGAGLGAIIGSAVPILGTAIGAAVGGAIGGIGGAAYSYLNAPSTAARKEAFEARAGAAGQNIESAQRLASTQFQLQSFDELQKGLKDVEANGAKASETVKVYEKALLEAANGPITQAKEQEIKQTAQETAAIDAYIAQRKKAGADISTIEREIKEDRDIAVAAGENYIVQNEALARQQQLNAKATRAVAAAMEDLSAKFNKVTAFAEALDDTFGLIEKSLDIQLSNLNGELTSNIGTIYDEILSKINNLDALSPEEYIQVASGVTVGQGAEGQQLLQAAASGKILQDQLKPLLRTISQQGVDEQDISGVSNSVRKLITDLMPGADASTVDNVLKQFQIQLETGATSLEELSDSFSPLLSASTDAQNAIKALAETSRNAAQTQANILKKQNELLVDSTNLRKQEAKAIRDSRLNYLRATGQSIPLGEIMGGFDEQIRIMTDRLVPGGTTDPAQIGAEIRFRQEQNERLREINNNLGANAATNPNANAQMMANQQIISDNDLAIREGNDALNEIANNTDASAAALDKIRDGQEKAKAATGLIDKVLGGSMSDQVGLFQELQTVQAGVYAAQTGNYGAAPFGDMRFFREFMESEALNMFGPEQQRFLRDFAREGAASQSGFPPEVINWITSQANGGDTQSPEFKAYQQLTNRQLKAIDEMSIQNEQALLKTADALGSVFQTFEQRYPQIVFAAYQQIARDATAAMRVGRQPLGRASGGVVYASDGTLVNYKPRGTDTVPAMLTPGEFVVNAQATKKNRGLLESINDGRTVYASKGGVIYAAQGGGASTARQSLNSPEINSDMIAEWLFQEMNGDMKRDRRIMIGNTPHYQYYQSFFAEKLQQPLDLLANFEDGSSMIYRWNPQGTSSQGRKLRETAISALLNKIKNADTTRLEEEEYRKRNKIRHDDQQEQVIDARKELIRQVYEAGNSWTNTQMIAKSKTLDPINFGSTVGSTATGHIVGLGEAPLEPPSLEEVMALSRNPATRHTIDTRPTRRYGKALINIRKLINESSSSMPGFLGDNRGFGGVASVRLDQLDNETLQKVLKYYQQKTLDREKADAEKQAAEAKTQADMEANRRTAEAEVTSSKLKGDKRSLGPVVDDREERRKFSFGNRNAAAFEDNLAAEKAEEEKKKMLMTRCDPVTGKLTPAAEQEMARANQEKESAESKYYQLSYAARAVAESRLNKLSDDEIRKIASSHRIKVPIMPPSGQTARFGDDLSNYIIDKKKLALLHPSKFVDEAYKKKLLKAKEEKEDTSAEAKRIAKLNRDTIKACEEYKQEALDEIQKEFGPGALDQAESIRQQVLLNKRTLKAGSREERLISKYEDLKRIPFSQRVTLPIKGEETRRRQEAGLTQEDLDSIQNREMEEYREGVDSMPDSPWYAIADALASTAADYYAPQEDRPMRGPLDFTANDALRGILAFGIETLIDPLNYLPFLPFLDDAGKATRRGGSRASSATRPRPKTGPTPQPQPRPKTGPTPQPQPRPKTGPTPQPQPRPKTDPTPQPQPRPIPPRTPNAKPKPIVDFDKPLMDYSTIPESVAPTTPTPAKPAVPIKPIRIGDSSIDFSLGESLPDLPRPSAEALRQRQLQIEMSSGDITTDLPFGYVEGFTNDLQTQPPGFLQSFTDFITKELNPSDSTAMAGLFTLGTEALTAFYLNMKAKRQNIKDKDLEQPIKRSRGGIVYAENGGLLEDLFYRGITGNSSSAISNVPYKISDDNTPFMSNAIGVNERRILPGGTRKSIADVREAFDPVEAFGYSAARSTGPTTAGIIVGSQVTAATAPVLGPFAPLAGLTAGIGTGLTTAFFQDQTLASLAPDAEDYMNQKMAANPTASFLGGAAPGVGAGLYQQGLKSFAGTLGQRTISGASGSAIGYGVDMTTGTDQASALQNAAMNFGIGFAQPNIGAPKQNIEEGFMLYHGGPSGLEGETMKAGRGFQTGGSAGAYATIDIPTAKSYAREVSGGASIYKVRFPGQQEDYLPLSTRFRDLPKPHLEAINQIAKELGLDLNSGIFQSQDNLAQVIQSAIKKKQKLTGTYMSRDPYIGNMRAYDEAYGELQRQVFKPFSDRGIKGFKTTSQNYALLPEATGNTVFQNEKVLRVGGPPSVAPPPPPPPPAPPRPVRRQQGGVVYANNGMLVPYQPKGTDTVPAMLTPGEFVVNRRATQENLPLLRSINNGVSYLQTGGGVSTNAGAGMGFDFTQFNDSVKSFQDSIASFNTTISNFGTYVNKLEKLNIPSIPDKIEMFGTHRVDVNVTGAAAFEAIEEGVKSMINTKIGEKWNELWQQSGGQFGSPQR